MEAAGALAGQSAGLIDEIKSAQAIIEDTVTQFFAITGRLGGLAAAQRFGGASYRVMSMDVEDGWESRSRRRRRRYAERLCDSVRPRRCSCDR